MFIPVLVCSSSVFSYIFVFGKVPWRAGYDIRMYNLRAR